MKAHIVLSLTWVMVGCKALTHESGSGDPLTHLQKAQAHLDAGEFYQARKITNQILEDDSDSMQAQQMMAEILNQEVAWQKEALESKTPEEFSQTEQDQEIRTWLERSQSLMQIKQYDQAIAAAEKVFIYDSQHLEASKLIDQIRKRMLREGRSESFVADEMRSSEIQQRVERYRRDAKRAIAADRWRMAKYAVEKILLLLPEDPEALRLQELIEANLVQEGM